MKKTILMIIMAVVGLFTAPSCVSQGKMFKNVSDLPGVTSVYIGPAMMKVAGAGMTANNDAAEYAKFVKDIKSINVLTCQNRDTFAQVKAECDSIVAQNNLELMLEANENDGYTAIYSKVLDPDATNDLNDMLIYNQDKGQLNIVYIQGKIDVAAIMAEAAAEN